MKRSSFTLFVSLRMGGGRKFPGDFSEEHFDGREIEILGREGAN